MSTLLIDNYDSFTWNVYQLLCAQVVVYRNDQISLEEAIRLNPRNLVISPGPGHPRDAMMSNVLLRHFEGKIPILGVCLGQQCMYELYGGTVGGCGELIHGKTTAITHDQQGLFEGVDQGIECTRYHSLAGFPETLPKDLEITCTTPSGIIMGVRHKKFVMEGVQFHPESIASEQGEKLFANFLQWTTGLWETNVKNPSLVSLVQTRTNTERVGGGITIESIKKLNSTSKESGSILQRIKLQRLQDVDQQIKIPGRTFADLETSLRLGLAPQVQDFRAKLLQYPLAVLAEIKRASPSKGDINLAAHAPSQALIYKRGNAACISVLTEPKWFKGSMQDLQDVRRTIDGPERPCVLCKDFILTKYQIMEARLAGADTVLLIVAILSQPQLLDLMQFSRSLGMEPLVEVATAEEMHRAVEAKALVIGVNNRDLHSFEMDMTRTARLAQGVPKDLVLLALSGISKPQDVVPYVQAGCKGVLVGQSLMESLHAPSLIQALMQPIVKICGITSEHDAQLSSQATHLGYILCESPRKITQEEALRISKTVQSKSVGVFMNQSVDFINSTPLDIAQVHFKMPPEQLKQINKPVWYVLLIDPSSTVESLLTEINQVKDSVQLFMVDRVKGWTDPLPMDILEGLKQKGLFFVVGGGLEPQNASSYLRFGGIDLCSGLEQQKRIKDAEKVKQLFIAIQATGTTF
ncbi:indole-3-glycerol phosphate synthase-domain-containing protein [Gorgonomyces haynaldii]|nr:indole-3-glycerol phosphate synthase-domain-containing protein [Gorgonomyces haynaldii]